MGDQYLTAPTAAAIALSIVSGRLISHLLLPLTKCQSPEDAWSRRPGANRNASRKSTHTGLRTLLSRYRPVPGRHWFSDSHSGDALWRVETISRPTRRTHLEAGRQRLSDVVSHWTRRPLLAGASATDTLSTELEREATFEFSVHQVVGMVPARGSMAVGDALVALRPQAFAIGVSLSELPVSVVVRDGHIVAVGGTWVKRTRT